MRIATPSPLRASRRRTAATWRARGQLVAAALLATTLLAGTVSRAAAQATDPPLDPHPTLVPPDDPAATTTTSSGGVTLDPSATTTTTVPAADPDAPPPVIDTRLSPDLANVPIEAPAYAQARSDYEAAWHHQRDAEHRQADAEQALVDLAQAEQRLRAEINETARRHDKSAARLALLRRGMQDLAVASYIRGGPEPGPDGIDAGAAALDPNTATREQAAQIMVGTVNGSQLSDIQVHQAIVDQTQQVLDADTPALAEVVARTTDEIASRAAAVDDHARAVLLVAQTAHAVADVRMTAMVTGTDLSLVALDAYWRAAALTALANPACRLRWQALAGVGRVETLHGRYGGGPVDGTGQVNPPIIGIALDGTHNTAAIPDTDGGSIDTDPVWDRAVGPMAFIPSSWRAYGVDGNGDGIKDVQSIYDASLASAGLLCRSGPLDTDDGLRAAYYRYNRSQVYVDMVLGFTHGYDLVVIPPLPSGA